MLTYFSMSTTDERYIPIFSDTKLFLVDLKPNNKVVFSPGDLTVSKRPGTSYQIKILFSIKTTKFLVKYNLLCFQIFDRLKISFTKHDYQVSTSFMKENKRYKGLKLENGFLFGC